LRSVAASALVLLAASGAVGQADRVDQYLGLAQATLAQPITAAELDAALLSPAGVDDVAALFEAALAARLPLEGSAVTPELGGEATLDAGRLRLVTYPDPVHAVIRRMAELKDEPAALLAFLSSSPPGREVLRGAGGLHALLYQMTTKPPGEAQRHAMEKVLEGAVARYFKTWTATPEIQIENIRRHDWRGRYVGFWHIHPPRLSADGYAPGIEPSLEDLTIAVEKGQLLTFVFQPEGFDAYDLSPLGAGGTPSLANARVVRHRSPAWELRFRALRP
jgi:hypothetical protein